MGIKRENYKFCHLGKEIADVGDIVNVFHYFGDRSTNSDKLNPITKGRVIDVEVSDDLSYHGSAWYEPVYIVLGEDGKEYKGTGNTDYLGVGCYGTHTYFTK